LQTAFIHSVLTLTQRTNPRANLAHSAARPPLAVFARPAVPIVLAVLLSVFGTLLFGTIPPATERLGSRVEEASQIEGELPDGTTPAIAPKVAATR